MSLVAAFGYGGEAEERVTRVRVERHAAVAAAAWGGSAEVEAEHARGGGAAYGGGAKEVRRNWARITAQETALLSHVLDRRLW